ncbi:MAG: (2Fe-2S)-binding protein [Gammaproteobacteria bacterium]|nr:(2Fe-2S)-binding protein [Gammaproteobacteria bacterium]
MYVCICNAVTESDIEREIAAGATTLECLQARLNISTCCGSCREITEVILEQHTAPRAHRGHPASPAAVAHAVNA